VADPLLQARERLLSKVGPKRFWENFSPPVEMILAETSTKLLLKSGETSIIEIPFFQYCWALSSRCLMAPEFL